MSQENLEVIRRGYELFNQGDFEGWLELLSPDVELEERYLAPDAGVYRGHDGVRRWAQISLEAMGPGRFEVQRLIDGGDVVVTEVIAQASGLGSGATTRARFAHAFRIRDGKAIYIGSFPTVEEALEAVGLSEQDAHADS